jgi:hypothetical protein
MVFENRVMRRIYGPDRKEVSGGWRKLHCEGVHTLYSSILILFIRLIKSRRKRWAGHVVGIRERIYAYTILDGIVEEKIPLRRIRRKRENNIKMDPSK